MKTVERTVEEIQGERDATQAAIEKLIQEQRDLEAKRVALLDDEDGELETAAMSGKPLGTRSEMRKVLDRLAELPALQHVLRKKSVRLQLELAEIEVEAKAGELERANRGAAAAFEKRRQAEDESAMAGSVAHGARWEHEDARRGLRGLRERLYELEQNRPKIGGSNV